VWAPVPQGFESAAAYCEHVLEQVAVVISPGDAYGPSGAGFFRISLTAPEERLIEAVQRLRTL
jgi:LL-diaminopimelate aminotransferase